MIRLATLEDRAALLQLWQAAAYVHVHAEWQLPVDWLGAPGFMVWEDAVARPLTYPPTLEKRLLACLALIADPLPAAWVRIAAASNLLTLRETFTPLLDALWPMLHKQQVQELGWLVTEPTAPTFLPHLGFAPLTELLTYEKWDLHTPLPPGNPRVQIRPVREAELGVLAAVDAAAYQPLWRYSETALTLARPQTLTFDVACIEEQIVGYLFSLAGDRRGGAHLVRLTVTPQAQGQGVGRSLMNHFLHQCQQYSLDHISLNTQIDNMASRRLYHQYGFRSLPDQMAVWHKPIARHIITV